MAHHRNKFGDGSKLMQTIYRPSFYRPQEGYGENKCALSEKRINQVTNRMYRSVTGNNW